MKVFTTAPALVIAVAASTTAADKCTANVASLATTFQPILGPASACATATGFKIVPPIAIPTSEQITAVCAKCPDFVSKGKAFVFPTCTVTIKSSNGTSKEATISELFNPILTQCGTSSQQVQEAGSTSGSNSTAGKSEATVDTPAPNAVPAASPKSAAPDVSTTLGAIVAVAFSVAALVL